jgi:hypothetical protein
LLKVQAELAKYLVNGRFCYGTNRHRPCAFPTQQFEKSLQASSRAVADWSTPRSRSEKSIYTGDGNIPQSQLVTTQPLAKFGYQSKAPSGAFSGVALLA